MPTGPVTGPVKYWGREMFKRVLDYLVMAAAGIAVVATIMMMLHVTADVIGRAFGKPITGTIEIARYYYMSALSFLPLALIARDRGHIVVDLFTNWMKPHARNLLDSAVGIIVLLYMCAFTWKAIELAIKKTKLREAQESGIGFIEVWPGRWFVAIGFGLMAGYVLVHIFEDFRRGMNRQNGSSDQPHSTESDPS